MKAKRLREALGLHNIADDGRHAKAQASQSYERDLVNDCVDSTAEWKAIYKFAFKTSHGQRSLKWRTANSGYLATRFAKLTKIVYVKDLTPEILSRDYGFSINFATNIIHDPLFSHKETARLLDIRALGKSDVNEPHRLRPRIRDSIVCANVNSKRSVSPFTGSLLDTQKALYPEVYYYKENCPFMLLCWSSVDNPAADTGWLIPKKQTVLLCSPAVIGHLEAAQNLHDFVRFRINHGVSIVDQDCSASVCLHESIVPHIGHYVWNVLSSWDLILKDIPRRTVLGFEQRCVTFGGLMNVYSREVKGFKTLAFNGYDDLMAKCINDGLLPVNCRGSYITSSFRRLVLEYQYHACDSLAYKSIISKTSSSAIVLAFGIRTGNRYWVNQVEGVVFVVDYLLKRFKSVALVLDGMNSDGLMGWTTSAMDINAELSISNQIESVLGSKCSILNMIGRPLSENLVALSKSDFFVAPMGAGLSKIRWICNLPGIIHSNPAFLDVAHQHSRLYDNFMEDPTPSMYLPAHESVVMECARTSDLGDGSLRDPYSFRPKSLEPLLDDIILGSSKSCLFNK